MDEVLIAQLAAMPPHLWSKAIFRYRMFAAYVAKPVITARDVEEVATHLGVSIRAFYRLLSEFKAAQSGQAPKVSRHGLSRHIGDEAERAIQAAVRQVGSHATLTDVQRELRRICDDADMPLPSERSIRTRLGDKPSGSRLRARIKSGHIWLLDSCALRIGLSPSGEGAEVAHLLAVFEIGSGQILAHKIIPGGPMPSDVERLLGPLIAEFSPARGELGTTRYLSRMLAGVAPTDHLAVIDPHYVGRTALGFSSVYGSRIGRIELNAFPSGEPKFDYPLTIEEVAPVVNVLIANRNTELVAPRECLRPIPIL